MNVNPAPATEAGHTDNRTLSERLRAVSFGGHGEDDEAEPSAYYPAFMSGKLNRDGVGAQVAQHYLIYSALEAATKSQAQKLGADFRFDFPELHRLDALAEDMEYWLGSEWESKINRTPKITEYTDRITEVCHDSLPLYIAHHYTRYLGDLSGGQMIGRQFARSYGLIDGEGMRFYRFAGIPDPVAFKNRYRELLDELVFDEDTILMIEREVAEGYRYNNAAIQDLDANIARYLA